MSGGDPAPDGSHGPHALVVDVETPILDDDDRHHLERVLRLRPGAPLTVGDGAGRWRECRFGFDLEPTTEVRVVAGSEPSIGVGFALIKGGRPELVIRKLTELGVDRIVPFTAEHSVVRWDADKAEQAGRRFERVAREAVMQCRRAFLPDVADVCSFVEVASQPAVAMADMGGSALSSATRLILVGPEGGWSDAERSLGLARVALAAPVLRAETAAIAAGVLLTAQREQLC